MDEKTKGKKGTLSLWGSARLMTDIRELHHYNDLTVERASPELGAAGMILVSVWLHVQT